MFISVQLLNGFAKELTYKVPSHLEHLQLEGMIVQVPLKKQQVQALVTQQHATFNQTSFAIKELTKIEPFPLDPGYQHFIEKIASWHFTKPLLFYQRLQTMLHEEDEDHTSPKQLTTVATNPVILTAEQAAVVDYLTPFIDKSAYAPTLLHGVTGSGKTEVYKKLIIQALAQQKSAILLLPEVSLALQFQRFFEKNLTDATILGFHSASTSDEKKRLWKGLIDQKPLLIIGVHLPILLPISNLALIIVDEEHEGGFQEKKHPKINSKEIAIARAYLYRLPILLGSATPSLNSLHHVTNKGWKFFQLKKRFAGAFPTIKKVSLIDQQQKRRKFFWITKELEVAIATCLAKKEQAIIYLNRRGFSFFVQCKACGFIFTCSSCSVSLTLHMQQQGSVSRLYCHYCGTSKPLPSSCSSCKAPETEFLKKGIGTQQVVQILKNLFPQATIERADMDTTKKKKAWSETVQRFHEQKIDILVGTKTITKGYHFPKVTLVGIIWADLTLHFPHFSASESTLQQLIQVAGRAGREQEHSTVIVQVMHDHDIFNYLNEQTYLDFATHELTTRAELNYPPFYRLIHLEISHSVALQVEQDALLLANQIRQVIARKGLDVILLGPAQPIIYKIKNSEIRQIFLKSPSFVSLHEICSQIDLKAFKSSIFVVPQG